MKYELIFVGKELNKNYKDFWGVYVTFVPLHSNLTTGKGNNETSIYQEKPDERKAVRFFC